MCILIISSALGFVIGFIRRFTYGRTADQIEISSCLSHVKGKCCALCFFLSGFSGSNLCSIKLIKLSIFFQTVKNLIRVPFFFQIQGQLRRRCQIHLLQCDFQRIRRIIGKLLYLFCSIFTALYQKFLLHRILNLASIVSPFITDPAVRFSGKIILFVLSGDRFHLCLGDDSVLRKLCFLLQRFHICIRIFLRAV